MYNDSELEFTKIDSEKRRTYKWGNGDAVVIHEPTHLNVSDNGHRLFDKAGNSHYVPMGWIHLFWEVFEGKPNFVK